METTFAYVAALRTVFYFIGLA